MEERPKDEKEEQREKKREARASRSTSTVAMLRAGKADCLFVGSFWCAHKQVETNNILAALRERADGEPTGERVVEEDEGGTVRLPQGDGNEANECREPTVINAGLGPTRLSASSPPHFFIYLLLVYWNRTPNPSSRVVFLSALASFRACRVFQSPRTELEIEEVRLMRS